MRSRERGRGGVGWESEMYLFDPHKKFIQSNNDNI